jgi:hypothetical protein
MCQFDSRIAKQRNRILGIGLKICNCAVTLKGDMELAAPIKNRLQIGERHHLVIFRRKGTS